MGEKQLREPRREIIREEWEIPAESDFWSNLGRGLIGLAFASALAAVPLADPVVQAIFVTVAVCTLIAGGGSLFVDRDVNRGRRPKRSRVIEEIVESGFTSSPKDRLSG